MAGEETYTLGEPMRNGAIVLVGLVALLTAACDAPQGRKEQTVTYRIQAPDGNIYQIKAPAGASKRDVVDAVLAQHPKAGSPPTFHGYGCTDDCSGHEAGYGWAEENGITNPDDCGGNSLSFEEGCRAYAEENY